MIEIKDLKKAYGKKEVLHGIDLEFGEGIYGLLGPNGAGKTTLMNLIVGLIKPTSGDVLWNGASAFDPKSEHLKKLGYLPQYPEYYKNFTAREFLCYMSALKGIPGKNAEQIGELLEFVNLESDADRKLGGYSGGMLRRVGLAQALLGDPSVIILDEPTAGLDPLERIRLRNLLSEISQGHTVIIATHIVPDVEYIANEVILMFDGRIAKRGRPAELTDAVNGRVWQVRTDLTGCEALVKTSAVSGVFSEGSACTLRIVSDTPPTDNAESVYPTLEDVFLAEAKERAK